MADAPTFQQINIAGTPHERGFSHGLQLKMQIADALVFYKRIFKLNDEKIRERATHFKQVITQFNPEYADEINAIAEGSEQDPLWIFALNARTEILSVNGGLFTNECTSMCFTRARVLGQTWDWAKPLEALCVLMRITRPDGHVVQMLTEPGIIGKIGMNSAGLGVCLNILSINQELDGVPIHVILRAMLDCQSVSEAAQIVKLAGTGKSSNIIVADAHGDGTDIEFAADETVALTAVDGSFVHTNHYLGEPINDLANPVFENSQHRLATAMESVLNAEAHTVDSMKEILSNRADSQHPIYRTYCADEHLGDVGTVATVVMDLSDRQLHIRKGNSPAASFETIAC